MFNFGYKNNDFLSYQDENLLSLGTDYAENAENAEN